jgi:hypothetical protein
LSFRHGLREVGSTSSSPTLGKQAPSVTNPSRNLANNRVGAGHRLNAGPLATSAEFVSWETAAFFVIDDFDQTLAELRGRGLVLQDYDLPHVKTKDGVLVSPTVGQRAWFQDPDSNVLGLFEQPFLTPPD